MGAMQGWEISSSSQMTELLLKEILKLHKLKLMLLGSSVLYKCLRQRTNTSLNDSCQQFTVD